jgi:hypothetical protein
MKCKCKIKYVLGKEDALILATIFNIMGKEYSKYTLFLKIEPQTAQSLDCEFLRSWGFNYYCVKRDVITKFQES